MGATSFKRSSLENFNKYNSLLVGNSFTPVGAYDLIETVEISASGTVLFRFENIPQEYKHLELRYVTRVTEASNTASTAIYLNSDKSFIYSRHSLTGNGSSVSSSGVANTNYLESTLGSSNATNIFGANILSVLDYSSLTKYKTIRTLKGYTANVNAITLQSGLWQNTDAVTEIEISTNNASIEWEIGSRFSLYGIRAA